MVDGARGALTVLLGLWLALAPLPASASNPATAQRDLDERVEDLARQLFAAYEQNNLSRFGELLGTDVRSNGLSGRQFYNSVNNDFSSLRGIQFSTYVHPPVYNPTRTIARVSATWFRRATFASSGEEWIVRAQTSILVFDVSAEPPILVRIEGAPTFGLSDPIGTLIVDRGEINGAPVTRRRTVHNGRLEPLPTARSPTSRR